MIYAQEGARAFAEVRWEDIRPRASHEEDESTQVDATLGNKIYERLTEACSEQDDFQPRLTDLEWVFLTFHAGISLMEICQPPPRARHTRARRGRVAQDASS